MNTFFEAILGTWASLVILDILYISLCNFVVCLIILKMNCADIHPSRCIGFTAIMTMMVSLPSYAVIFVSNRFMTDVYISLSVRALLQSLFSFRNPLWLAVYFVTAHRILKIPRRNVASSALLVFYISELFALLSDGAEFLYLPFQDCLSPIAGFCVATIVLMIGIAMGGAYLFSYIDRNIHLLKMLVENGNGHKNHVGRRSFLYACALWSLLALGQVLTSNSLSAKGFYFVAMIVFIITLIVLTLHIVIKNAALHQRQLEYSILFESTEDLKGIQHDMNNVLQVYQGFIRLEDYDGLRAFHEKLFDKAVQINEELAYLSQLQDSPALCGLFMSMEEMARKLCVDFNADDVDLMTQIDMSDFDLCRLLSNLMRNAIESAALASNPIVQVKASRSPQNILLTISNTTKEKVEIAYIFKAGFSTKCGHQGRGLHEVNKILANYYGCTITPTFEEPNFIMYVELPRKPSQKDEA